MTKDITLNSIAKNINQQSKDSAEKIKGNVAIMVSKGAPESDIDQYISASGFTVDDIKNAKKTYVGKRPGIDTKGGRLAANIGITATQIAAPIAAGIFSGGSATIPTSVATAGAGEYLRALTEGKSQGQALKSGAFGAGADLVLGKVGGAIGKGATGLVKRKLAGELGEEATEKVIKNIPKYTKKSAESYKEVTDLGRKSISSMKKTIGKEVGEAKTKAISNKINFSKERLINDVDDLLRSERIKGARVLRGKEGKQVLGKVTEEVRRIPKNPTAQELLDVVDNIDDSLKSVYRKDLAKQGTTVGEGVAERIRGITNKRAMEAMDATLPASKKRYSAFMEVLNDEGGEIKRALNNQKSFNSLLESATKDKRWKTLDNLIKLDELLPDKSKFMDRHLSKLSNDILRNIKSPYLSEAGLRTTAYTMLPRLAAKGIRGSSTTVGKTGLQATKTLIRTLAETAARQE